MLYVLGAIGAAILGWVAVATRGRRQSSSDLPDRDGQGGQDHDREPPPPTDGTPGTGDPAQDRASTRDSAPPDTATAQPGAATMTTASWAAPLAGPCLAAGIPLSYALRWVELESGGNPCAVGYPPAHGTDGQPLELGVAQLYNPDDLGVLTPHLTGTELRAYCVPGDHHQIRWRDGVVTGFSSEATRALTPAEVQRQADATAALIRRCMTQATSDLVHVGATWSESRRDFWALVKLQHGLPTLSRQGLPRVTAYLGRPPRGWAEFASALSRVKFSPEFEAKFRGDVPRILANAERTASAVPERGTA